MIDFFHTYFWQIFLTVEVFLTVFVTVILKIFLRNRNRWLCVFANFLCICLLVVVMPIVFILVYTEVLFPNEIVGIEGVYYILIPALVAIISYLFTSLLYTPSNRT